MNNILFIILGIIIVIAILFVVRNIYYVKQKSIDNNFQKISNNFVLESFAPNDGTDEVAETYFDALRLYKLDGKSKNTDVIYKDTPSSENYIKSSARKIRPAKDNINIANTKFLHIFTLVKLSEGGSQNTNFTNNKESIGTKEDLNQILIDYLNKKDPADKQGYMLRLTSTGSDSTTKYTAENLTFPTNGSAKYGDSNNDDIINMLKSISDNIFIKKDLYKSQKWELSLNYNATSGKTDFYHLLINCRYIIRDEELKKLRDRIKLISITDSMKTNSNVRVEILGTINGSIGSELYINTEVPFCSILLGLNVDNKGIYKHLTNEFMTFLAELLYSKLYDDSNLNYTNLTFLEDIAQVIVISSTGVNIDFKEYLNLVLALVKLRKIFTDQDYLKDYNEKYLTFLFYSFNRGKDIFENTLNNLQLATTHFCVGVFVRSICMFV